MNNYFVDLHIHIGRTSTGKPVKITGAKSLTLENIIREASEVKGLNIIGIIDAHVPEVIHEWEDLIAEGMVTPLSGGGLRFKNVVIIPGSEIEIYDEHCQGPIHLLAYFPDLPTMKNFSEWLSGHMKNITLSSQRFYGEGIQLQKKIKDMGGLFIPAHVFTPHKGLYGNGVERHLSEILDPTLIDAIELGLSANTEMADQIPELHDYGYVSNSDAHSLPKMAREYQKVNMAEPTFEELSLALHEKNERGVTANYGLDPRLGKYHRTMCESCYNVIDDPHARVCPYCGNKRITKGVYNRLEELKEAEGPLNKRPPYIHQVPLEFIPGIGPRTLLRLREHFGTEMAILHKASSEALRQVVSDSLADLIIQARQGDLSFRIGGGGRYGKVKN